jgi:hypothetical protein
MRKMKFPYGFILLPLVFIVGSCQESIDQDFSLSVKEYKELGLPDPDKVWHAEDYRQAYIALSRLKLNQPLSLPRKESKKSGLYFSRLVSPENISFLKDDSISLKERAYRIQSYLIIQSDLDDLYTDIYRKEQYYHRELIDLYLFGLSVAEGMLDLSYQINVFDDEEAIQIRSAFSSIQYTYLTMLGFILDKQKNASLYEIKDLERLTDRITNSIMQNREWMKADARNNLKGQLKMVMDSVSSEYIEKRYFHLLEGL